VREKTVIEEDKNDIGGNDDESGESDKDDCSEGHLSDVADPAKEETYMSDSFLQAMDAADRLLTRC
jgi:hypothetical protein